ncbi:MAG: ATP-binding protein [Thermodesulfobacteriota bacterium]|nr:ATP-binding protein [Thermodesulfobacteriota bacterium]
MKLGFQSKIYLGLFSLLLLLGMVILFVVSMIMKEALLEENRNRGISIGSILAARMAEPVLAVDFLRMKTLVDETVQLSDDIFYTFVLNDMDKPLVHTFKGGFPVELREANTVSNTQKYSARLLDTGKQLIYDYAFPIIIDEDRFGTVRIGLLRTKIQEAIYRLWWSTFLSTGIVIIIAIFVGTAVAVSVTRRVKILHKSSEQALMGNLDIQTAPLLKKNCWEIMKCNKKECPAYGEVYNRCWYLAGTLCPDCIGGDYAQKIESCKNCQVYHECAGDEIQSLAESFDTMALSLKTHLSELQNSEKILKEQRQLLKTVLDATPDFVSLQDINSIYLAANKSFCDLVSRGEQEIIGRTDYDLFPKEQAEKYLKEDRRILKSGKPMVKENSITGPKGSRWLHMVKIPVYEADGKIGGLLCSGRDITEFKRIQEQLSHAQKMESIGQLIAGIAHEINTPMGIILGYVQLLLEEGDSNSQAYNDLKIVEKQTRICKKIVSDLLRFSRRTKSTMSPININDTIEDVLSVVEHTFSLDRVSLVRRLDPDLPTMIGDKEKIKQAIINLVNNAFDAIRGDGMITISTHYNVQLDEIIISVLDTGEGIQPEEIDKIFDPFYTTKPVGKGTGLGLAVTFGIVQEHNGKIEVESPPSSEINKEGKITSGTLFIIHLPVSNKKQKIEFDHVEHIGVE